VSSPPFSSCLQPTTLPHAFKWILQSQVETLTRWTYWFVDYAFATNVQAHCQLLWGARQKLWTGFRRCLILRWEYVVLRNACTRSWSTFSLVNMISYFRICYTCKCEQSLLTNVKRWQTQSTLLHNENSDFEDRLRAFYYTTRIVTSGLREDDEAWLTSHEMKDLRG
jgi:hypothetical protein